MDTHASYPSEDLEYLPDETVQDEEARLSARLKNFFLNALNQEETTLKPESIEAILALGRDPAEQSKVLPFPREKSECVAARRPREAAFTLVELLVVVAIISILAGMLLPALDKTLNTARQAGCASNFKQFAMNDQMYVADFDGWCLPASYGPDDATRVNWPINKYFAGLFDIKGSMSYNWPKDLTCPTSLGAKYGRVDAKGRPHVGSSHGINAEEWVWSVNPRGAKLANITKPAGKLEFTDGTDWHLQMASSDTEYLTYGEAQWNPPYATTAYRHNKGVNLSAYDGHVEYRPYDRVANNPELWKLFQ